MFVGLMMQFQNTLDDASYLIKKEKREEAKRSEASGAIYNTMLGHVEYLTRQTAVQRNMLTAKQLYQGVSSTQPQNTQNIVRLLEKALKAQRQLSTLDKDAKDIQRMAFNEFHQMYLVTMISYFITLYYFSLKKHTEAYVLYENSISEIQNCLDYSQRNSLSKI